MSENHANRMFVQVEAWREFPWLWHGFSTRRGGVSTVYKASEVAQGDTGQAPDSDADLNLGWTKDDDAANVVENRRRLVEAITGLPVGAVPLVTVRQIHSSKSLVVPQLAGEAVPTFVSPEGRAVYESDGLMTNATGLLLGIQTADCVPVLVADTRRRVVAGFHAGWRGTAARIVELGVAQMRSEFGSAPNDLIAAIGPSIGACCYSVGEAVHEEFLNTFTYGETLFRHIPNEQVDSPRNELLYLDLWEANRRQLIDSGISADRIETIGECTGCIGLPARRRYFSHRRENGCTGRMLSVIGIADRPAS